jgi:hypothetical protein
VRRYGHKHPELAGRVSRLERSGLPVCGALLRIVGDARSEPKVRGLAARLLRDIGGNTAAFVPLLAEFLEAGDEGLPSLCEIILSIGYGAGRLTRPEFEILHEAMRGGTPEQRYWVVNHIAFFDRHQVRPALLEVLADAAAPGYVRAWAAERLHLHISQATVRACVRAIEDPNPEVRLWAVYTLGNAASMQPGFRDDVIPVLEKMLTDTAVVPGWWSVHREAQSYLAHLCGGSDGESRLQAEVQAILRDPSASAEDKHWAGFNDES